MRTNVLKCLIFIIAITLMVAHAYGASSQRYGKVAAEKIINNPSIISQLAEIEKWAKEQYPPKQGYWRDEDAFDNDDYSLVAVSTGWNLRVRNGHFRGSVVDIDLHWDGRIIVLEGDDQAFGGTWYPKLEIQKTRR